MKKKYIYIRREEKRTGENMADERRDGVMGQILPGFE